MEILLSRSPEALRKALGEYKRTATVEAEYGAVVVEGTEVTLAHHGPRSGEAAPCVRENNKVEVDAIGISHLDLDTLGGILSLLGEKPHAPKFWAAAGAVDINGPHKLGTPMSVPWCSSPVVVDEETLLQLNAYWRWAKENRGPFSKEPCDVLSAMDWVKEAQSILGRILDNDEVLLAHGQKFMDEVDGLNRASFVMKTGAVAIRQVHSRRDFVNHMYNLPAGQVCAAVVTHNTETGCVTLSLADPIPGVSCVDLAQTLWGKEAGGHAGIAGSPRSGGLCLEDAVTCAEILADTIITVSA